jgi:hypothetical protein
MMPLNVADTLSVCVACCLQGQSNGLAAEWAEELSLDVSPEGLAAADALLLLEVLQLPSGFARFKVWPICCGACLLGYKFAQQAESFVPCSACTIDPVMPAAASFTAAVAVVRAIHRFAATATALNAVFAAL